MWSPLVLFLDPTLFGPGTLDPNQRRRSIYFFVKRSRLVPMMTVFDAPDSLQDVASRADVVERLAKLMEQFLANMA